MVCIETTWNLGAFDLNIAMCVLWSSNSSQRTWCWHLSIWYWWWCTLRICTKPSFVERGAGNGLVLMFRSLASVTHGHGTQALYWRCAKQKDCAKIFHCFKSENKASSRSAPPTTAVASLYTLDPQEFFGRPRRCGCSAIRGRRVWPENTHCLLTSVEGRAAIFPKSTNWR